MSAGSVDARAGDKPFGFAVIDKPAGCTSHDVVNVLRRRFGTKRVGHTGTLDPMATGVLILCVGAATRLAEYVPSGPKEYHAEIVLGVETDTEDTQGRILNETYASHLSEADVASVLDRFRGQIAQVPPMASAVQVGGVRLYKLARKGEVVDRPSRSVEVYELQLQAFEAGRRPKLSLRALCSAGTYIRTLAADIGKSLEVGGAMSGLRRVRIGPINLSRAESPDVCERLLTAEELLVGWPMGEAGDVAGRDLGLGRQTDLHGIEWTRVPEDGERALIRARTLGLTVVAERTGNAMQPKKVMTAPSGSRGSVSTGTTERAAR